MHNSVQFHWIEPAEVEWGREYPGLRRAASESQAVHATTRAARFEWPRAALARALGSTVAAVQSLLVDAKIWAKAASRATLRPSPAKVDCDRVLVAVLITDIVDSTKWAAEVGDRNWRVLLDRHHDATRYQIKRFGGREVGNRGDGFVGIFDSPSRAVRCASAIADTIAPLGILLRSGIHAGEVDLKGGEISGIAVHIAARIAATAHPGEACISRTVRDLVAGSGLVFEDRGIHRLRGVPEEIHLYAMPQLGASTSASVVSLEIGRVPTVRTVTIPHCIEITATQSTRVNPGTPAAGHEEQFSMPSPSDRCRFPSRQLVSKGGMCVGCV